MCEFESGIEVDSTFDEPYAAKRAREIFAICERNLKE
jgi:hypothetical protein